MSLAYGCSGARRVETLRPCNRPTPVPDLPGGSEGFRFSARRHQIVPWIGNANQRRQGADVRISKTGLPAVIVLMTACATATRVGQGSAGTSPAITAQDLSTRLYIFADDSMLGRQFGTEGNLKGTQ